MSRLKLVELLEIPEAVRFIVKGKTPINKNDLNDIDVVSVMWWNSVY